MFGRIKAGVAGSCVWLGQAVGVGVSAAVVLVEELFGCCDAHEGGCAVERIRTWGSQGDAGRDVCEECRYERGVGRVFEERIVGRTRVGGFGVLDYREDSGVELVKKVGNEKGVCSAIDNVVLAAHYHVEVGCHTSRSALTSIFGIGRTCIVLQLGRHLLKLASRE